MDLRADGWIGKRHSTDNAELYCRKCGRIIKRCDPFEMENYLQWTNLNQRCQCGAQLWFVRDI